MRLANNSCFQKFMVSITQITQIIVSDYCIYYNVYSSFILCKLQVYMSINGVYTLITHPIIGLKQCKVLNLTMTLCICTIGNLISFLNIQHLKGIFQLQAENNQQRKQSAVEKPNLYVPHISQNYCQWVMQMIVFPVKFQGFRNNFNYWGGTVWLKCPKTA